MAVQIFLGPKILKGAFKHYISELEGGIHSLTENADAANTLRAGGGSQALPWEEVHLVSLAWSPSCPGRAGALQTCSDLRERRSSTVCISGSCNYLYTNVCPSTQVKIIDIILHSYF